MRTINTTQTTSPEYHIEKLEHGGLKVTLYTPKVTLNGVKGDAAFMYFFFKEDGKLFTFSTANSRNSRVNSYISLIKGSRDFKRISQHRDTLILFLEMIRYRNRTGYSKLKTVFKKRVKRTNIEDYLNHDVLFYEGTDPKYFPMVPCENPVAYYVLKDKVVMVYKKGSETVVAVEDYKLSDHLSFVQRSLM